MKKLLGLFAVATLAFAQSGTIGTGTSISVRTSERIDATKNGAQAYYNSLFNLYATWGVDFVKVDDITRPYHRPEVEAIRRAAADEGLVVVGQVHEAGEALAQAHGVDDREADLAGRHGGQHAEHGGLHRVDRLGEARALRFPK